MKKYKLILFILTSLFIQSCAIHGSKHDELISKVIQPPAGSALIYIIRAPGHRGGAASLPFIFNQVEIGKIWRDQYLYVFAKPMDMLLPAIDGSVGRHRIEPNKVYYILYGYEKDALDSFIHPIDFWDEKPHFTVLSNSEGKALINSYSLSGKFKRVTIGASIKSKTIRNNASNTVTYEYIYESKTNQGSVTVKGSGDLRSNAINQIKEICNVKNIALSANKTNGTNSTFTTLNEIFSNKALIMNFECLY